MAPPPSRTATSRPRRAPAGRSRSGGGDETPGVGGGETLGLTRCFSPDYRALIGHGRPGMRLLVILLAALCGCCLLPAAASGEMFVMKDGSTPPQITVA